MENNQIYTEDQLMARLRFFIGICLALTLTGIVFVVLYSIIFVTQPLNAISPIDQKFFELIIQPRQLGHRLYLYGFGGFLFGTPPNTRLFAK